MHFNKKSRNNKSEKQRHKRDKSRDKAVAKMTAAARGQTDEAAAESGAAAPSIVAVAAAASSRPTVLFKAKTKESRLAVSGKRTGKHRRKIVRKWQKARTEALESGAVSMEDIVLYAANASAAGQKNLAKDTDADIADVQEKQHNTRQDRQTLVAGFRVKPSKKVRLRLKRQGRVTGADGGDQMVE